MQIRAALARLAAAAAVLGAGIMPVQAEVDHYVLALSWSPTYCETTDRDEPLQCGADEDHGFIVHGLWPNTASDEPAFCRRGGPNPSGRDIETILDLMPSRGLVRHQWRKHGTCSGLDPAAYFDTIRRARERVAIPPALDVPTEDIEVRPEVLREAFLRLNPGLPADGIYLRCSQGDLVDVRVCLSPDLDFIGCPQAPGSTCRGRLIDIPAPE